MTDSEKVEEILELLDDKVEKYSHYDLSTKPSREKKAKKEVAKEIRREVKKIQ